MKALMSAEQPLMVVLLTPTPPQHKHTQAKKLFKLKHRPALWVVQCNNVDWPYQGHPPLWTSSSPVLPISATLPAATSIVS